MGFEQGRQFARLIVCVGCAWAKIEGRAEGVPDGGNSKCKDKEVGDMATCLRLGELHGAATEPVATARREAAE